MTDRDAGTVAGELSALYRDLTTLDSRPEGMRFRGTSADGMPVVVTALAAHLADQLMSMEDFLAELSRAGTITGGSLPAFVTAGRTAGGTIHFAHESRDGEPLSPGSMPATDIALLGAELARDLHIAHGHGMVHGAISTMRIAAAFGHARLEALGLYAALYAGGLHAADAVFALSTPPYVAPEVRSGDDPTARADVYSLGASLYELLTGKPPFGGRTTSFVMASVLSDDQGVEADGPEGGTPVVDAILRAIESNPEDRWPDAAAFAETLGRAAGTPPSTQAQAGRGGCLPRAAVFLAGAAIAAIIG